MTLVEWLTSLPHISDVRGCRLTICGRVFDAARYSQTFEHPSGEYNDRFYVVGERPKKLKENKLVPDEMYESKYNLKFPNDDGDWYTACHMDNYNIKPEFAEFHPFGANFLLGRWPHEQFNQRIDHFDAKKRERLPVEVQWTES